MFQNSSPTALPLTRAHFKFLEPETVKLVSVPCNQSGLASLRPILDEFGFAIVTNVIVSQQEIQEFERAFAADLTSGINFEKSTDKDYLIQELGLVSTAASTKGEKTSSESNNENWRKIIEKFPLDDMPLGPKFASDFGLPQGRLAWKARLHPNVQKVYSAIYGSCPVEDLCCGTDVIFFENRDPILEPADDSKRETPLWPHTDQNNQVLPGGDHHVYQSLLYLWSSSDDDTASTTVVWPKSHKEKYQQLMSSRDWSHGTHYCRLPESSFPDFIAGSRRVPVPAGAMLVFSSSLIHQGWNVCGGGGKRLTVPLCFEKKSLRSYKALEDKIEAVLTGNPTTHWASLGYVATRIPDMKRLKKKGSIVNDKKEEDVFEITSGGGKFVFGARIHQHFSAASFAKHAEHPWEKNENSRQVPLLEKGSHWLRSWIPYKFGGMPALPSSEKIPQCVLDLL